MSSFLASVMLLGSAAAEEAEWMTIGVLVEKGTPKESASGGGFCVWRIADLERTESEFGVLLFGDAYASQWKQVEGDVFAVLSPKVLCASV